MREAFALAFDQMGGVNALVKWGKDNPSLFYPLASKLIPIDVNANVQARITVNDDIPAK